MWDMQPANMFSYIWRSRFVGWNISAALQYVIIALFITHLTFFIEETAAFCDLDIALSHTAFLIVFWLIVQPKRQME